jgi:hypothetical protein
MRVLPARADMGTSAMPFFGSYIKLDKALLRRARRYADLAGYSSVDEFITHVIEKELAKLDDSDSEQEIRKRLRGLGYIS